MILDPRQPILVSHTKGHPHHYSQHPASLNLVTKEHTSTTGRGLQFLSPLPDLAPYLHTLRPI
jgi:hypothetical protein